MGRPAVLAKRYRLRHRKRDPLTQRELDWLRRAEQWLDDTRNPVGRKRKRWPPIAGVDDVSAQAPDAPPAPSSAAPPVQTVDPGASASAGASSGGFDTTRARFVSTIPHVVPDAPQKPSEKSSDDKAVPPKAESPPWHGSAARQVHAYVVRTQVELAKEGLPTLPKELLDVFPDACERTLQRFFPQVQATQEDIDNGIVATVVGSTVALKGISAYRKRKAARADKIATESPDVDPSSEPSSAPASSAPASSAPASSAPASSAPPRSTTDPAPTPDKPAADDGFAVAGDDHGIRHAKPSNGHYAESGRALELAAGAASSG